jgi:5-methyltetrahydropteroyltriglutamate--homocysteine methyltransferase
MHSHVPMELMKLLKGKDVLVGVIDVASDKVETPEEVAHHRQGAQVRAQVAPLPLHQLRHAPMESGHRSGQLRALVEGAALARKRYK